MEIRIKIGTFRHSKKRAKIPLKNTDSLLNLIIANDRKELINDEIIANCVRYMAEHYSNPRLDVETLSGISFMSVY